MSDRSSSAQSILILVTTDPRSSPTFGEALRMAIGMTLADLEVTVAFVADAASALSDTRTAWEGGIEVRRYLDTLVELDGTLLFDGDSATELPAEARPLKGPSALLDAIFAHDRVVSW